MPLLRAAPDGQKTGDLPGLPAARRAGGKAGRREPAVVQPGGRGISAVAPLLPQLFPERGAGPADPGRAAEQVGDVGKKRIKDIMQELGLESIRENAKKDYKKRREYQRKNLLEQNFKASRQNEIWASDITYFKVKDYSIYFCVIIDLFSRKIVSYRVSRKCSVQLVSSTFKKAFQNRDAPMIMRWRKPSSRHLKEKRLTAMNILQKQISEKA